MHRTTDRTDPLDASGDAGFIEFSDAAMENIDALIENAVSGHRAAVTDLADLLELDGVTVSRIVVLYNAVTTAKKRIDMLVALKERGGIWA